jgi:hypothetical protein
LFEKKTTQLVEVILVFNYSCNQCYETYTLLDIWNKYRRQPYVKLEKVLYNSKNKNEAILFGLRQHFGFNEQLDKEIMKGLQTWQFNLDNTEDITAFFHRYFLIPESEIITAMNSKKFKNKIDMLEDYASSLSENENIFFIINHKETTEIVEVLNAVEAIMKVESLTSLSDKLSP